MLKSFSAAGVALNFSLHGIMNAWRNQFGLLLKRGDVAAVVTVKAFAVTDRVPAQSIAACVL